MKKTFTRALSLILVLVALLGVMPTALALEADEMNAASFTLSTPAAVTLKVGQTHQILVAGMTTENEDQLTPEEITDTYSTAAPSDKITVSETGLVTAVAAGGPYEITVTGKGTRTGWTYTHVGTATVTVTVTADPTYSSEAQTVTLSVGEEKSLDPTAALKPAYTGEAITWTLSGGNDKVSVDGMKIKGLAAGSATITASTTAAGISPVTFNVTVPEPEPEYVVTLTPATLNVAVDAESEEITVAVMKGDVSVDDKDYTLGWKSSDATVATVNSGVVTGKKVGTAEITAVVTIGGKEYTSSKCVVTVKEAAKAVIDYTPKSAKLSESITLTPTLKINGVPVYDAKFKFEKVALTTSVTTNTNKRSASVASSVPGAVEVKISVEEYKLKSTDAAYIPGTDIEPVVAYARFYETRDMTATVVGGKAKFSLSPLVAEKVFSKVIVDGKEDLFAANLSFKDLLGRYLATGDAERTSEDEKRPYIVYFDASTYGVSGQVENISGQPITYKEWSFLDQAYFSRVGTRTGTTTVAYNVVDTNGLTMLTGNFSFVITGGEGDVHYETTYNKPITLKKADFQSYWSEQKLGNQYLLEYVTFDTAGIAGTLYTDSTKKTPVTSGMKFYLQPARDEYALANVYYVPDAKKTSEYVDSINFTLVSNYTNTRQVGTMTITLNAKSSNITARGMVMGSGTTSYTEQIAAAYKDNTGTTLGYVIFDLPEAKYGKLYSKLPAVGSHTKVAQGVLLDKDEPLYYSAAKITELPLKDAAFIPAAGFSGEVELTYTAYDKYGYSEYKGTLRLNVTKKTASGVFTDVNAKNYSWAADSVDFLYYEGTAQGSNGKYNPASNITRRDFMLMLYRAFLADSYKTFNVTSNFPDVVKGTDAYSKEIYQAVGVAKYLGIAQGSNDKFNPKANITRQEAMVLIYRTLDVIRKDLDYTVATNITAFKDYSKISSWAVASISYLVNHGVIQGTNDMINPAANITRAEMACILHRVLTY